MSHYKLTFVKSGVDKATQVLDMTATQIAKSSDSIVAGQYGLPSVKNKKKVNTWNIAPRVAVAPVVKSSVTSKTAKLGAYNNSVIALLGSLQATGNTKLFDSVVKSLNK